MPSHYPISAIITTNNESDNIEGVLQSISEWIDDILVIDSFSTDDTLAKARKYTDRVYQRAYIGPADQKNWAIPQAKYQWVLILDADERVNIELRQEIIKTIEQQETSDAYWIPRQNYFMAKKINYSGWQNDAVIRLIQRDKCRYNQKQVHEEIETKGINVGRLACKLDHYTFKNTEHFIDKMQRYGLWSALDYASKTPRVTWFHLLIKPFFRFFRHFILKLGFLDGKIGFIISVIMAWGVFIRYMKLKEMKLKI